MESERNVVAQHYEQTFDQVNQQIDSARQLVEIRKQSKQSPDRPYPRRPKNRVNQASMNYNIMKSHETTYPSIALPCPIQLLFIKVFQFV